MAKEDRADPAPSTESPRVVDLEPRARETRDSISDIWGQRYPYYDRWPERVDERTTAVPDKWVPSACVLCSNGCALDIGVKDGRIVGVRGRGQDRVNRGRLGPKGLHGWIANHSADRLGRPLIRRDGRLVPTSWDDAMTTIVKKIEETRAKYTSNAIAFYTSGQLMLEEYYTLAVIGKAGLGTPHMDGNTRLCTATAARALMESFGSDGQPGSYRDIDLTDALFLVGHNVASQQTVLWSRILDRRAGPRPPKIVVVDPRRTETAKAADVHLAPRAGTNVALLNGLIHLIIAARKVDRPFVDRSTVGFDELERVTSEYPPERTAILTGVPVEKLRAAAEILGSAPTLVSTVLQGVYQSLHASAAAVQVNNLHLIRGMIGKPGCTVLQMNGQPTSENTRECGADGELPAFRNWRNPDHVAELARIWNVEPERLPSWQPPTHAMQIFRHAEEGTIKVLWIVATNPAVSLPEIERVKKILSRQGLFVIVQDAFPTETTELADVVLPAAIWAEKTGTFTNTDRTCHLSLKAIEPPGEARSDLDIFLDLARRLDLRDKDGAPLVKWSDAEGAFEAWKVCSKGRPCDYSGMSYAKLRGGSGIQWPCNVEHPDGAERLYDSGRFETSPERCTTFGHDLMTGAAVTDEEYRARDPGGKAVIKSAQYQPPLERPDEDYPLLLTTGRVVHHFHTRTKTGRSRALSAAAPDAFVQISLDDAARLGVQDGDPLEVSSRRGKLVAPARLGDIEPGHLFVPFHYGWWDDGDGRPRAANELTITQWDPASKQPHFKFAAVRVRKLASLELPPAERIARGLARSVERVAERVTSAIEQARTKRPHVADYLALVHAGERALEDAFRGVAKRRKAEPDVHAQCETFAWWCDDHARRLAPLIERHGADGASGPRPLRRALLDRGRSNGLGLVLDLHDLWLLSQEVHVAWVVLHQAARALRDDELRDEVEAMSSDTDRQLAWLRTRIETAAPQALVVPS